jgi:hypothetical protein
MDLTRIKPGSKLNILIWSSILFVLAAVSAVMREAIHAIFAVSSTQGRKKVSRGLAFTSTGWRKQVTFPSE